MPNPGDSSREEEPEEQVSAEQTHSGAEVPGEGEAADNVREALRPKDPDEEVEDALGAPPEPPGEDERDSAGDQPGEPPD
ncbi:hypothetical protein [Streptomyces sp. ODS28]|uniref:hypothetical protein n=1 Tax=Streptomyces sp. ODS28 TaxID=3136688 RepID=UPI0031EC8602